MLTPDLGRLAEELGPSICRCSSDQCDISQNDPSLCRSLIQLLAEGQPVSLDKLATVVDQPHTEVAAAVNQSMDVELDEAGNIVGAGLSLRPTPHRIELEGRVVYAWCALDALMYPPVLGHIVQVESPCAGTGIPVRVTVTPEGVEAVDPPDAIVSIVVPEANMPVRHTFCDQVHFFSSPQAADLWLAQHPGAVVLPVADAYALGRLLAASAVSSSPESH